MNDRFPQKSRFDSENGNWVGKVKIPALSQKRDQDGAATLRST